jgi:hypothetical protein
VSSHRKENVVNNRFNPETAAKHDWMRPELRVIEAGSAESGEAGAQQDASAPQRS